VKTIAIAVLVSVLMLPVVLTGHTVHVAGNEVQKHHSIIKHDHHDRNSVCVFDDDISSMEFKHNSVIITYSEGTPEEVEVTERHELIVDGKQVKLNPDQQKLVSDFYEATRDLIADAKEIGLEGAAVGLQGAKVAVKAVAGVFEMLCTSYTSDDLERDVEREAAKIERRAEKLEVKADKIEAAADNAERLYDRMEDRIPELHRGI
jgi:hypothetical protein